MKTTSPKKKSKNFYFSIVDYIKKGYYPVKIANSLGITKQQLNYYITTLKQQGCIKKLSQGAWLYIKDYEPKRVKKINLGNLQQPQPKTTLLLNDKNIRGHAFMFHLKLRKIYNWNKRRDYLDKKNIKYEKLKYGEKLIVKERIVHLFQDSIIIYDRDSYISSLAKETKSLAVYNFLQIINKLENIFKLRFDYRKQYQFKVCREHYALMKNCLAKQCNKEGTKIEVYNSNGQWMLIDNSFNLNETEILKNRDPNQEKAVLNTEGIQKYFNSHERTEFKVTPEFILTAINGITNNQLIFDSNMKSHLDVLNKLSLAVDELRKEIKNNKR